MSFFTSIAVSIGIAFSSILGFFGIHTGDRAMLQDETPAQVDASMQADVSARGSSNADLEADLSALDSQVNAASQANASVEASLNDQPVSQSY